MASKSALCSQLISGQPNAGAIVTALINQGRWLTIEPWPDDRWRISVKPEAADALRRLVTEQTHPAIQARSDRYRQRARIRFEREGELEIDDAAPVSQGEEQGAYVQCWVWIDAPDSEEIRP
jgi:hypothetical protein